MTCQELFERLDAYHAGQLDRPGAEQVERHLLSCDSCKADYRFQRALKSEVAGLPREIAPPAGTWDRIASRLGTGAAAPRRPWWTRTGALAAAALLLVALSSGVTAILVRSSVPEEPADRVELTEAVYRQAAEELALALEQRRGDLSPAALAVIEQNLRIIDEAIRETQAALAADPANSTVAELLWASWEKKLDLLERAAQHAES